MFLKNNVSLVYVIQCFKKHDCKKKNSKKIKVCFKSLFNKLWRGLSPRTDSVRTENMHKVVTRAEK